MGEKKEKRTHPRHNTLDAVTGDDQPVPRIRRPPLQQLSTDTVRQEPGRSHDNARVLVVELRDTAIEGTDEGVFALEIEGVDAAGELGANVGGHGVDISVDTEE
jgi:hypothetical protein